MSFVDFSVSGTPPPPQATRTCETTEPAPGVPRSSFSLNSSGWAIADARDRDIAGQKILNNVG